MINFESEETACKKLNSVIYVRKNLADKIIRCGTTAMKLDGLKVRLMIRATSITSVIVIFLLSSITCVATIAI